jgi:hypothetical protein
MDSMIMYYCDELGKERGHPPKERATAVNIKAVDHKEPNA